MEESKLPEKVQEIISYYGNAKTDGRLKIVELWVNLFTELSPYLEDKYLPNYLTHDKGLGPRRGRISPDEARILNKRIAKMIYNDRTKHIQAGKSNQEPYETL